MVTSVSVCPVPPEQRPINEFQALQTSWFFHWSMLELPAYLFKLFWIWSGGLLLAIPVAASSFAPAEFPLRFCIAGAIGAGFPLVLVLLRLYLGWMYICERLQSETVVYEETGWYDGQSWAKPADELARERLIGTYQVQPVLKRLRLTLLGLGVVVLLSGGVWSVL
jgi:hypothetical protein